jgi:hypothetical protein
MAEVKEPGVSTRVSVLIWKRPKRLASGLTPSLSPASWLVSEPTAAVVFHFCTPGRDTGHRAYAVMVEEALSAAPRLNTYGLQSPQAYTHSGKYCVCACCSRAYSLTPELRRER